jgi:putative oxidoreductase
MFPQLMQYNDVGLFLLRAIVGVIFLYHGLPKLSKSKEMAGGMGVPASMVMLLGLVETLSAVGLMLGLYTQICAALLALVMVGAIKMKAMKWGVPFSAHDKTGWEFDILLFFACLAILLSGGGAIGMF